MVGRIWIPITVFAVSLALSGAVTWTVASSARERDEARFANAVQSTSDRLEQRLELYIALLRSGVGLFAASDSLDANAFRAFSDELDVSSRYPGIQGIGFTRKIEPASVTAVEAEMRATGDTDFRVWPPDERAEYHSILYLEPRDIRNEAAIGFDMYTEENRRRAMDRARDTGDPALSGKVTLVQEIVDEETQAGFLIYAPVYQGDYPVATVADRRSALLGFVYAPFRADDLFVGIFGTEVQPRVAFEIFDGSEPAPERLLHSSARFGTPPVPRPQFTDTIALEIAGQPWTLVVAPTRSFELGSRRNLVPVFGALGFSVSLILFALAFLAVRSTEEAEEARAQADHANRAKSQFLATMSHELRTPLNAIAGYVDILELGVRGELNEAQRRDLERIRKAQQHLLGLITDVLNFAKLEVGRVEFRIEEVTVESVLIDLDAMVAPLAIAKGVEYQRRGSDMALAVYGDREKMLQILLNLLSNAIKFTEEGGRVEVDTIGKDGFVGVAVRDSGVGIPPERLRTIFEPFVQVANHLTRQNQGTGLGLAIASDLAEGMRGRITVESAPGAGSAFTLWLRSVNPTAMEVGTPAARGSGDPADQVARGGEVSNG
jgi:signal transduction histidine kinase